MNDRLIVERLEFMGHCGVSAEERDAPQPMALDLDMVFDMAPAAATDDLARTVDYTRVTGQILSLVQTERFQLLETLAERIAALILEGFPVAEVTIWARKLKPPVHGVRDSTGVRITRESGGDPHGLRPAGWLVEHSRLITPGRALDVACGRGRNSLYLARNGFQVDAWDRDAAALEELGKAADAADLSVTTKLIDLEQSADIQPDSYDLIAVFFYLQRDLMPRLIRALKPGGLLLYETFLIDNHERFGHPRRREFCLERNELLSLTAGLRTLAYREGLGASGSYTASLAAQQTS